MAKRKKSQGLSPECTEQFERVAVRSARGSSVTSNSSRRNSGRSARASRRGGRGELQGDRNAAAALDPRPVWTSFAVLPAAARCARGTASRPHDVNALFAILFDINANVLKVVAPLAEDNGEEEAEEDA
jgi:hypothetical protein